jgi:nucleoside-diphosphate-sugar epimerase
VVICRRRPLEGIFARDPASFGLEAWLRAPRFAPEVLRKDVADGRARDTALGARQGWNVANMKVPLTGGAGDLGQTLVPKLRAAGDAPVVLDLRTPASSDSPFICGSVLDRGHLPGWLNGIEAIVHIAAWHGIHEFRGEKDAYDFFDLNVRGTFEVFEAASRAGVRNVVHLSTTSLHRPDTLYARSKIIAEGIAADYAAHSGMNVVTLRPRGFIPHWNRTVYTQYRDWAAWFWKGAVHIDDVAQAVMLSLKLVGQGPLHENPILTLDSAYEYTDEDLANWDADGPATTFRKYYPMY